MGCYCNTSKCYWTHTTKLHSWADLANQRWTTHRHQQTQVNFLMHKLHKCSGICNMLTKHRTRMGSCPPCMCRTKLQLGSTGVFVRRQPVCMCSGWQAEHTFRLCVSCSVLCFSCSSTSLMAACAPNKSHFRTTPFIFRSATVGALTHLLHSSMPCRSIEDVLCLAASSATKGTWQWTSPAVVTFTDITSLFHIAVQQSCSKVTAADCASQDRGLSSPGWPAGRPCWGAAAMRAARPAAL